MTVMFASLRSASPNRRAIASALPPAVYGTTTVTGLAGQFCAIAPLAMIARAAPAALISNVFFFISSW